MNNSSRPIAQSSGRILAPGGRDLDERSDDPRGETRLWGRGWCRIASISTPLSARACHQTCGWNWSLHESNRAPRRHASSMAAPSRRSPRAITPSSKLACTSWHLISTLRSVRRRRKSLLSLAQVLLGLHAVPLEGRVRLGDEVRDVDHDRRPAGHGYRGPCGRWSPPSPECRPSPRPLAGQPAHEVELHSMIALLERPAAAREKVIVGDPLADLLAACRPGQPRGRGSARRGGRCSTARSLRATAR